MSTVGVRVLKAHVTLWRTTRKKALSLTEAAARPRARAQARAMEEHQAGTARAGAAPRSREPRSDAHKGQNQAEPLEACGLCLRCGINSS